MLIGSESPIKVMNNSSLVFKPIKRGGRTIGIIGVLGPRRMNYKQVLKTLDDIGGNISGMMNETGELKAGNITDKERGDNDGG